MISGLIYWKYTLLGLIMTDSSSTDFQILKSRLNANPQDYEAAVGLGNLYYDAHEAALAIVYYSVAIRLNPNAPEVMTDMATMYWQNGDIGLSEQTFREAINLHPEFGNAYLNLGLLLAHGKDEHKKAIAVWNELISALPEHPAAQRARQLLIELNQ